MATRCERRAANQALRNLRRSSSDVPPQTPDSWLVAEREVEAGLERVAGVAHALGRIDLVDGRPGRANREEKVRFCIAAGG